MCSSSGSSSKHRNPVTLDEKVWLVAKAKKRLQYKTEKSYPVVLLHEWLHVLWLMPQKQHKHQLLWPHTMGNLRWHQHSVIIFFLLFFSFLVIVPFKGSFWMKCSTLFTCSKDNSLCFLCALNHCTPTLLPFSFHIKT